MIDTLATPFTALDVCCILGLERAEYELARVSDWLPQSIRLEADPTGRFAFHSFWDFAAFEVERRLGPSTSDGPDWPLDEALDVMAEHLSSLCETNLHAFDCTYGLAPSSTRPLGAETTAWDGSWERWVAALVRDLADRAMAHLRELRLRVPEPGSLRPMSAAGAE